MNSTRGFGNQLRIIGGRWRGRRLSFPPLAELRPTPDRVRETLFNWLAPVIEGARCLDLFAGSGALGIEALSRGAAEVVFIERHPAAARRLQDNLRFLGAESFRMEQVDALIWLEGPAQPFDIVFLDPPFDGNRLGPACAALEGRGWLAPIAHLYLESGPQVEPLLPDNWRIVREKTAGQVTYRLAVRRP